MNKIELDWSRLLGFDQVPAACNNALVNAAKIGEKRMAHPAGEPNSIAMLRMAKVGDKGPISK